MATKNHPRTKEARRKLVFVPPKHADGIPPHSIEAERGALGCVIMAGQSVESLVECDSMLRQLKQRYFYDLRHLNLFTELAKMRMDNHSLEMKVLSHWLRKEKKLMDCGELSYIMPLADAGNTLFHFPEWVSLLQNYSHRRYLMEKGAEISALATAEKISLEDTKDRLAELFDAATKVSDAPMMDIITPKEARDFVPDPQDFLIGEGLIMQESFFIIGGEPGCGKSRLLTTLAVALARGNSNWQGYPVRTQTRSLILQSENKGNRLREEFEAVPRGCDEFIRVSRGLSHGLAFMNPDFRRELRRFYDKWPFQFLGIDPWNDVSAEDGQADYKEALRAIASVFNGVKMPAVGIVAHLRKTRSDSNGRRKSGRELLHELSGSLALGSTARTMFVVQPETSSMDNDKIIFEVSKANDCDPKWLSEHGTRSAWHRMNGAFAPCHDFDWEEWDHPNRNEGSDRKKIRPAMIEEVFGDRPGMKRSELVRLLIEKFEIGESTAWRGVREAIGEVLDETAGIVSLKVKR